MTDISAETSSVDVVGEASIVPVLDVVIPVYNEERDLGACARWVFRDAGEAPCRGRVEEPGARPVADGMETGR
ncbi:hypothetical protein [Nocardia sp. N2S4-5]|uniref:hypothetical protein n=1 Tax=Nocardia sp. N2S4-5 TaxID=3351565 RepID=UPI0037CFEB20